MHYVTDVQIIAVAAGVVVHFLVSTTIGIISVRKAWANGRGIQQNHDDLTGLDVVSKKAAVEIAIVNSALTRLQATLDGRVIRRAGDTLSETEVAAARAKGFGAPWSDPTTPRPTA